MSRSFILRSLACTALAGILSGCNELGPDPREWLTLYVAPVTVDCVGVAPQRCLLVKEHPNQEWSYFYGTIAGFTYEPGYSYTLWVERRHIRNPPADGSSSEYRLLRILARDAAPSIWAPVLITDDPSDDPGPTPGR
ncbi:MAG: DUF4377 domain-containing protein [Gemmatimonadaceae bacterium]